MSLVEQALRKIQAQAQARNAEAATREASQKLPIAGNPPAGDASSQAAAPTASVANMLATVAQRAPLVIDQAKLRAAGLLPPLEHERLVTRQLRAIKHALLRKMANDPLAAESVVRTVMVTSGVPGDGKSFFSINLAMSMAMEKDLMVLLVDADVLKPHITTELGLAGQTGLLDILADPNADIVSCLQPTQTRGLFFLPAGRASDVATELLSSDRMVSVIRQLVGLHQGLLVIFDSSPMLVTAEAQSLASLMSQILLIVRSGITPQAVVRQTVELLAGDISKVSMVLNDARDADASNYEYGAYGAYGDAARAARKE
ncbi:MAG TPA: P-loop NTPase [Steroidobacteraceae bacterium]|nr:P-loop NTPase [Steroidobacteraceae bacterium]